MAKKKRAVVRQSLNKRDFDRFSGYVSTYAVIRTYLRGLCYSEDSSLFVRINRTNPIFGRALVTHRARS